MPTQNTKRLLYLDGMRGLAALVVVVYHLIGVFDATWGSAELSILQGRGWFVQAFNLTPLAALTSGGLAVLFFFVQSGFVLSHGFFARRDAQRLLTRSAGARYFRLTIPVAACIFLAYFFHVLGWYANAEVASITGGLSWLAGHYRFTPSFGEALRQATYSTYYGFQAGRSYNSALWTIQTELVGSFLVYAFLALFGSVRHRWVFHAVALFLFHQTFLLMFVLGIVACDFYCHPPSAWQRVSHAWRNVISGVGLFLGFYLGSFHSAEFPLYTFFQIVPHKFLDLIQESGAALILFSLLYCPPAQKILESRPCRFLGRVSYSLYLVHVPVLCSATCQLFLLSYSRFGFSYELSAALSAAVTLPFLLLLSSLFCRRIDEPAIRFGRRFYESFFMDPKTANPGAANTLPQFKQAS